ncbi:hypothetical protein BN1263170244 [Stenotrophomonas indicatrix]|nr:hypothetical protein BN1263170244 [Stenotrophomonas indicatrix]
MDLLTVTWNLSVEWGQSPLRSNGIGPRKIHRVSHPSPENCRRRGGVGLRGVSRMDAAAKPTRTYLRRPRHPTPPRHPRIARCCCCR